MAITQNEVTFQSDDLAIHGTLAMPETSGNVPSVIIFHGMTSSEQGYIPLAVRLAEAGIAGLAISMRGHGESEGDFNKETVAGAVQDAVSAYDFLINQPGVDAERIGLVGSSVGAILAAMAASHREVQSLVFRAPAAYTKNMMQLSMAETMTNERSQFHEINDLAATPAGAAIAKFSGSLLVAASEHDELIPQSVSQGYVDIAAHAANKRLIVIEGAAHKLTEARSTEAFTRQAVDRFSKTL